MIGLHTCNRLCAHVLTICFIFNWFLIVDGRLSTRPTNTETVQGHSIRLNCSTIEPYLVNWQHTPYGAKQREFVYFGGEVVAPYHQRFRVVHDQEIGRYDLVIESVQVKDAGTYWCTDSEGMGEKAEAELVVLSSPPNCTCEQCAAGRRACYSSTNRNQSSVSCSLTYLGNVVPSLTCPSNMQPISTEAGSEGVTTVKYVLQYKEDTRLLSQENCCYTSLANISSNIFISIVTNENYDISRKTINQPSQVNCELATDRNCRYRWIRADSNETTSNNRSCYITEPGIYRCEADCSESGFPCKVQPVEIKFAAVTSDDTSEAIVIGLTVGIAACVSVVIVTIIVAYKISKSRNSKKDRQRRAESAPLNEASKMQA